MADYIYDKHGNCEVYTVAEVTAVGIGESELAGIESVIPVPSDARGELNWFMQEIKKAFRGCEIRSSSSDESSCVYHVYMPEDEYTMGWIDVSLDYSPRHSGQEIIYTVHSRDIRNKKFDKHSSGSRRKHTIRRSTALKNAKRYLRRFSHTEVIQVSIQDYQSRVTRADYYARQRHGDAWDELFGSYVNTERQVKCAPLLRELYLLLDSGHTFLDASLGSNLTSLRSNKEILEQSLTDSELPVYGIRVRERMGQQVFDVCFIEDAQMIDKGEDLSKLAWDTHMHDETLPEGVIGKLSTLAICEKGTYVPQVGYRHSEAVFYVTK